MDRNLCREETPHNPVRKPFKMSMNAEWVIVNIVGNFGVLLILLSYFALQLEKVKSNELRYLLPNLFGSICIVISLLYEFNFPSLVIEVCWSLISLFGLTKLALRRRRSRRVDCISPLGSTIPCLDKVEGFSGGSPQYGSTEPEAGSDAGVMPPNTDVSALLPVI